MTDNPPEIVESLLADYPTTETQRRAAAARAVRDTLERWNHFAEEHGSFTDEHTTL